MAEFGVLEDVPVRIGWSHEAHAFTPWLAQNLGRLGSAVGLQLEHVQSEAAVDSFAADILARNVQDSSHVLIENQLEVSDHTHLGQIMTYLAGLDARAVIWVAPQFREPHLSAIRWLNQHTAEDFAFFAVQLRIVRIGDSPLAPLFDVLERPNGWERRLQGSTQESGRRTALGEQRLTFWTAFCERLPNESAYGVPTAASSRTVPLDDKGLVVARYLAVQEVGLFIRGPARTAPSLTAERLAPLASTLSERLGTPFNPTSPYFFIKKLSVRYVDEGERERIIRWLDAETERYVSVLRSISELG
ncbi:hypothetical protein [Methylobacterium bullatum]|uniref:DUF4268 domain-containing protein n=1 Tax=Methylobacterium bullatum TaxID=570505 RepID=A0AAV4ZAC2_9HYPH|nr:hypothetical protein [Methylobacterium bullatum]MBD8900671.1 hypothetical protein [Methylobacterium bullatum]GJD40826.1 hypothetical protein OICFNHDK_3302 [Methylobacterium bullatum]